MATKNFKSIDDQINLLKSRNLLFGNEDLAKEILRKYNYFDIINGTEDILLSNRNPKTYDNVFFEDFYKIYQFDFKLKSLTLAKILEIEARLRTSISYNFSKTFCSTSADLLRYTDRTCYQYPQNTSHALQQVFNQFELFRQTRVVNGQRQLGFIDKKRSEKNYIHAYRRPPFWVIIKDFNFGTLYYTYCFQKSNVKNDILGDFSLTLQNDKAFEQALLILKEARNNCAHIELISRFKISCKSKPDVNYYNDIKNMLCVHTRNIEYIHLLKILSFFCDIEEIKHFIHSFYLDMYLNRRLEIVGKVLKRMGEENIDEWMSL